MAPTRLRASLSISTSLWCSWHLRQALMASSSSNLTSLLSLLPSTNLLCSSTNLVSNETGKECGLNQDSTFRKASIALDDTSAVAPSISILARAQTSLASKNVPQTKTVSLPSSPPKATTGCSFEELKAEILRMKDINNDKRSLDDVHQFDANLASYARHQFHNVPCSGSNEVPDPMSYGIFQVSMACLNPYTPSKSLLSESIDNAAKDRSYQNRPNPFPMKVMHGNFDGLVPHSQASPSLTRALSQDKKCPSHVSSLRSGLDAKQPTITNAKPHIPSKLPSCNSN